MRFENASKRNQICPTRFRDKRETELLPLSFFATKGKEEKQKPAQYLVDGERQLFFVRERCCGAKKKEEEEKKKRKKEREEDGRAKRGKRGKREGKGGKGGAFWSQQKNMYDDDDDENKKNSNANPFFFALKDANGCYPSPGRPP